MKGDSYEYKYFDEKMLELNELLTSIMEESGYNETYDLLAIEWDETNPNDCMLYSELFGVLQHLDYVHQVLDYLGKPISHEGILCYGGMVNMNSMALNLRRVKE